MHVLYMVLALLGAFMGMGLFMVFAHAELTDPLSARITIDRHLRFFRVAGRAAVAVALVNLLLFACSMFLGETMRYIGILPLVFLNICLASLSGIAGSLARILSAPHKWTLLHAEIDEITRFKEVLRKLFGKFFIVVFIVFTASLAHAGDSCAYVDDPTISVSTTDLATARAYLDTEIVDLAHAAGCRSLVRITVGCDVRHAPRTWFTIPPLPILADCVTARPAPLEGEISLLEHLRGYMEDATKKAVAACETENSRRQAKYAADVAAFRHAVASAPSPAGSDSCSRITELVRYLLARDEFSLIIVVTDLIDNPPADMRTLRVPPGTHVVVILTRPTPPYARVDDGLARAAQWARIPGITVVTVAELTPRLWTTVAGRRTP